MLEPIAAQPAVQGAPVVAVPSDGSPATFTWTNGVLAADISQSKKGAQDLIAKQIAGGAINADSSVTINPDNSFTLRITKDVLFQTVTVQCQGTLAPATDAAGQPTTIFNMTNGTVDSGGLATADQIVSQLATWAQNWETQAQAEPRQPAVSLLGE